MSAKPALRERLAEWLDELAHVLPAQAPIRDFVHHNTLHGFQHLPFAEALAAVAGRTGARPYWPEAQFRAAFAAGRISRDDLAAAFDDMAIAGLDDVLAGQTSRRQWLLACLLADERCSAVDGALVVNLRCWLAADEAPTDWRELARQRCQTLFAGLGAQLTLRALLCQLSGEDVLETVRSILQRHLAAHLDLGLAAWRNPARGGGFFAAWKASAGDDLAWELSELPGVREEIHQLPADPWQVLEDELRALLPDEAAWPGYLERLALEMPGWSGMCLQQAKRAMVPDAPVSLVDWLAVRLFLERQLCSELIRRLTGAPLDIDELRAYFLACPGEFLVRDALARDKLPEDLQAAAAGLCADALSGKAQQGWDALAAAIAGQLHDDTAEREARHLGAALQQLDVPPALDATTARTLAAAARVLDPLQRGAIWLAAGAVAGGGPGDCAS